MKDPGEISSRRDPTAEKARTARTPSDLRAAILAREGTAEGLIVWPIPCLAMKAIRVPEGREEITIGAEGYPQGYMTMSWQRRKGISYAYSFWVDLLPTLSKLVPQTW